MEPIRWGILGCGKIAAKFAESLSFSRDSILYAVASRSGERAQSFASTWGALRFYDSYEMLLGDSSVDVVYVATTNDQHYPTARLCLESGKPVLLEKPFTINYAQAVSLVRTAETQNLFLMEAMWSRFFPAVASLLETLHSGRIGEVGIVSAELGQGFRFEANHRLFDPYRGGGSLLDLGVYLIDFARRSFGCNPHRFECFAAFGKTGIDESLSLSMAFEGKGIANLAASINIPMPHEGRIYGSCGSIKVSEFNRPSSFEIVSADGDNQKIDFPYDGPGYHFEVDEVARCLRNGRKESTLMPLADTLDMMKLLDSIRKTIGLSYPDSIEKPGL